MTTQELSNKLTSALKDYLKSRGYIDSGALYNSIKFIVIDNPSTGLDVKLDAEEYIKYLDDGKLLDKFFALDSVGAILSQYIDEYISNMIDNIQL